MAQLTVKKRRKYSKKSKKNLRKYTDIRDVEEFLEEQRFQERTGGLVSEKKDEQLFFVQSEATSAEDKKKLSRAERRKRPLRSLSHLYGDPVVSGTNEPTNPVGSVANEREAKARRLLLGGAASDSSEDEAEFDVGSRFSVRRRRETRELVRAVHRRLKKSALKPVMQDIWADEGNRLSAKDVPDEHFLRVTRKLPVKKPVSVGGRPSGLGSVPLPPPGSSYNPAFDDHQELLRSAVDVEEARLAADMKINKRLEAMEPMTATQREKVWQDEMIEGLIEGQEEEEEEEEEGEETGEVVVAHRRPTVAGERKTHQKRRREEERSLKEKQKLAAKMLKSRMNDVYRLRSLKKAIEKREGATIEMRRKKQLARKDESFRTKRLGRLSYLDAEIDVQLSSEITGALRSLKCEGSLARDRYKSLQKRNIIEPRERIRSHRKYKLKVKEKRSKRLPEEIGASYFHSRK